jgi:hypothetical protein
MVKYVVLALVFLWTVVSVPIGLAIWPQAAGTPPGQLLPFFMIVSLLEGAAFALGVAFLVFGGRVLGAAGRRTWLTSATYIGIAWLLMSWWPHDGLHRSAFGRTFAGLATIDTAFHTTVIVATAVVVVFFTRAIRSSAFAITPPPAKEPATPVA